MFLLVECGTSIQVPALLRVLISESMACCDSDQSVQDCASLIILGLSWDLDVDAARSSSLAAR